LIKLEFDVNKIQEGIDAGVYDEKGLTISKSRTRKYPSKLMLIKALEPYLQSKELRGLKGTCEIWSVREELTNGTETLHLELTYHVPDLPNAPKTKRR